MIPTTQEYKEIMNRSIRNKAHVRIVYGLNSVDDTQLYTQGSEQQHCLAAGYLPKLKRGQIYKAAINYAYLSVDSMRTNGTQIVMPRNAVAHQDNGYVTKHSKLKYISKESVKGYEMEYIPSLEIIGDGQELKTRGFTLFFDELTNTFPKLIKIIGYKQDKVVFDKYIENNSPVFYYAEDNEVFVDKYMLTFDLLNKPNIHFRINGISLGMSKTYMPKDIMSCSLSKEIDFLSNSLSKQILEVTINNYDKHYNPLNPVGIYKEFDVNHTINVEFGRELDSGDIEWLQVANLVTDGKPKFSEYNYTITATDKLTQLVKTNTFTPSDFDLRDKDWKYWLDSTIANSEGYLNVNDIEVDDVDLSGKATCSPLIPLNEALQLFSNVNKAVLTTNNVGQMVLKNGWIPNIEIQDNGHIEFSDVESTINMIDLPIYSYALLQPEYMETEEKDKHIIVPKNYKDIIENRGFISSEISDTNGSFQVQPTITIDYSLPVNEKSLRLVFNNVDDEYAVDFDVEYYRNKNELVYKHVVTNNNKFDYTASINQKNINRIIVIIKRWSKSNHRAVINKINSGKVENMYLTFHDMLKYPELEVNGTVKNISVSMTSKKESEDSIVLDTLRYDPGEYWYINESEYYKVYPENAEGNIEQLITNNYGCKFRVINSCEVTFKGISFAKNETLTNVVDFNKVGNDIKIENPLCCCRDTALELSDWYFDYIKKGMNISFETRGNPELEPFDFIFIQTQYEDRIPICITKLTFDYDGGLKGTLEGVRI